jgi:hypothetical protein
MAKKRKKWHVSSYYLESAVQCVQLTDLRLADSLWSCIVTELARKSFLKLDEYLVELVYFVLFPSRCVLC